MKKPTQTKLWIGMVGLWIAITLFHYCTDSADVGSHNFYRRLYYLPIVWAAFVGGARFGIAAALLTTLVYVPHAFLLHHNMDPAPDVDKAMEIVLYFGVGALSGWLVDRERQAGEREQKETLARVAAENRAVKLSGLVHLSRGLAHEIRNPLGGIQGAIEILSDEIPQTSPRREMVAVALRETGRLHRVLNDFLEFARPREPVSKPFAPTAVVEQVVGLQRPVAEAKGVRLRADAHDALPLVLGDLEQIAQVLLNLVSNAVQATAAGHQIEVRAFVADRTDGLGDRVRFEVQDNGPGIPAELGDSIYDPYVTGRGGGTGLGLSISSMLVQQNGGILTHESRAGQRTVFRFELPAAAPAKESIPCT